MAILLTILGISLLIFLHELGHFICARIAGVKVHTFSLGFGPRLWGFQRGDTDYRISAMPLGGYVQVAGDDPTRNRKLLGKHDLCNKSFAARAFFYSGGVLMNLLFALVAFPLVFNTGVMFEAPILGSVDKGGPAWEAGLQEGDRILQADGKEVYSFPSFRVEAALANRQRGLQVIYERGGKRDTCTVFPRYSTEQGLRTMGVLPAIEKGPFPVEVETGSPEYEAGLRTGDKLLTFNGKDIFDLEDWREAVTDYAAVRAPAGNKQIELVVRRPRSTTGEGAAGEGEKHVIAFAPAITVEGPLRIGVAPAETRVAGLRRNADIDALGLRRDDIITFVDGKPFRGGELDFSGSDGDVEVTVARGTPAQPYSEYRQVKLQARVPAERRAALAAAIALEGTTAFPIVRPLDGSPAETAGLHAGDIVQTIDDTPVATWEDLVQAVKKAGEKPIAITVLRRDGFENLRITARRDPVLGFVPTIQPVRTLFQTRSFAGALEAGFVASFDFVKQIYVTLRKLFTGDVSTRNLGGIITISRVSYAFAQEGLTRLFYFLAILSINLAVINVLPIPVLDGGHLTFLLIEKVKGSPVSTRVHNYSQILGLVFVLALMVYVTFNDIVRWIG